MKKMDPLTGLRGIAAYSVLVGHAISCSCHYGDYSPMQPFESRIAYFGMALFFVLSGFVIQYNYTNLLRNKGLINGGYKFFVARFARLFPLYAMIMIFSLDKIPSKIFHHKSTAELAYITLTQSWFDLQQTFFAPAWSISTECFFYLFFLLTFPFFDRIKKPILFLTVFTLLIFLFLPNLLGLEMTTIFRGQNPWITYYSPFTRVFEFIAGMFSAKIYVLSCEKDKKLNVWVKTSFVICVAWVLLVMTMDPLKYTKYAALLPSFMFAPALAPLLYLCCRYDLKINKLLCSRYMLFMGEISYSVYLLGFLMMTALSGTYVWHKPSIMAYINSFIKIMGIVSLTTLIAYGSYNLVEVPCRNFIRRVFLFNRGRKMNQASIDGVAVETSP